LTSREDEEGRYKSVERREVADRKRYGIEEKKGICTKE